MEISSAMLVTMFEKTLMVTSGMYLASAVGGNP
jgi:hypothetical protein